MFDLPVAVCLGFTVLLAAGDWLAVVRRSKSLEYFFKPATMVGLAATVVALGASQEADPWQLGLWIAAIVLSMAGDIFLMLPRDLFVAGLASFLLAHLAYIAGLSIPSLESPWTLVASVTLVAVLATPLARRVLRGADGGDRGPVALYVVVVSAMVAVALTQPWREGPPLWAGVVAACGALLFYASDAMIGWGRFVGPFKGVDLAIIVTYHVGQILLVAALVR
ncbi:MAG: lysoplasmalogenase [Actinobacteria bacterium ATB1]|nr:lysoplasmalogenase [Actinobacteria bacterium ATB1]